MVLLHSKSFIPLLIPSILASPLPPPGGQLNSEIIQAAGGGSPNGPPPTLTQEGITGFQLLGFLENLQASYYYQGLLNLTGPWSSQLKDFPNNTVDIITRIAAQEDVHVSAATGVLHMNNATSIPPCNYTFPVSNADEFFTLATILTTANYGSIMVLQDQIAATDPSTVGPSSSILAVEARHDAFLRSLHGLVPNPAPFDTRVPLAWAYNIGLEYVVPGSCPVEVPLQTYPRLSLSPNLPPSFPAATDYPTTLTVTWSANQAWVAREAGKPLFIAWVNLYDLPQHTALNVTAPGAGITAVPTGLQGVVFAAITTLQPTDLTDLGAATLAGPVAIPIS